MTGRQRVLQGRNHLSAEADTTDPADGHRLPRRTWTIWRGWARSRSKATPEFRPDKIRSLTKLKTGAKVRQDHVTRALERLRNNYQKNDHLEAQVSLTDRHYH